MPIQQSECDALLAEFLQQREITKYKATRKQAKLDRPERVIRPEFEPDNSRIERQSRGIQSNPLYHPRVAAMLMQRMNADLIARAMVDVACDALRGVVAPSFVVTVVNIDSSERIKSSKAIRPAHFGERVALCNVPVKSLNQSTENVKCQMLRIAVPSRLTRQIRVNRPSSTK